jgi:hypothetical protein
MNTYDTLLLARLRLLPIGAAPGGSPIPRTRLSDSVRAELDDLIASLERRTSLRGAGCDVRSDVLKLLGIVASDRRSSHDCRVREAQFPLSDQIPHLA